MALLDLINAIKAARNTPTPDVVPNLPISFPGTYQNTTPAIGTDENGAMQVGRGIAIGSNELAKPIVKGAAEFAVSAGEAVPRLAYPPASKVVIPPSNVPILSRWIGPVQSFQSQTAKSVSEGASPSGAIKEGTINTLINEPTGIVFKPLFMGLGLLGKRFAQGDRAYTEALKMIVAAKTTDDAVKVGKSLGLADELAAKFADQIKSAKNIEQAKNIYVEMAKYTKPYTETGDLTTKILKDLEGKTTVSKQYILDATNRPELKQVERDITRQILSETPGDTVNVNAFAEKLKEKLLPIKAKASDLYKASNEIGIDPRSLVAEGDFTPKYENVSLPADVRGNVHTYRENIYESPVKTSAGDVHYRYHTDNYFGHTRVEDMGNSTRRVIEVQSDLYQKGNLGREGAQASEILSNPTYALENRSNFHNSEAFDAIRQQAEARISDVQKLAQYNDPTAHYRMVREEIKKAAEDEIARLQFPTGETAMKVEGLGYTNIRWRTKGNGELLKPEHLKVGEEISSNGHANYIITDVLGDGKFVAAPKREIDMAVRDSKKSLKELIKNGDINGYGINSEEFDISRKIDTNNPIYKFYEKDLGKYLKNNYGAELVTDAKGVTWWQVPIKPEYANAVEAFKLGKGTEYTRTLAQLQADFKKITGQDIPVFMRESFKNPDELGRMVKGVIELLQKGNKVSDFVGKHELWHLIKRGMVSTEERALIETLENDLMRSFPDKVRELKTAGYEESRIAEELMADEFARYYRTGTTFTEKAKIIFDKIVQRLEMFLKNKSDVLSYFENIQSKLTGEIRPNTGAVQLKKQTSEAAQRAEAEVLTQMQELSQAGYRYQTEDLSFHGVKSSFPSWVPDHLRSKDLFDKTIAHYEAGTVPRGTKQQELLDVIKNQIRERTNYYSEMMSLEKVSESAPYSTKDAEAHTVALEVQGGSLSNHTVSGLPPTETVELASSLDETIQELNDIVNLERMNISEQAKTFVNDTVDDVRPMIEEKMGKTLSNKEVIDVAQRTSETLTKVLGREKTLEWEAAMLNTRNKLARLAESGVVNQEYIDTLLTVKTLGADIARKLQSYSIVAQPRDAIGINSILEDVLKTTDNVDEVLRAAEGVDFNNFKQATEFYRKFVKPKMSDWVDLLRYNSMLSSPLTHIVNTSSNLVNSLLIGTLEKLVNGGIDAIRSTVTGTERRVFAGEAGAFLKSYASVVGDATGRFAKALSGESRMTNLDIKNMPLATKGAAKVAETVLSFPMRLLEASDQFFTALTEAGEKASFSYRESKGVKVRAPLIQAQKAADYRLYRQELFPEGQGVVLDAIDRITANLYQLRNSDNAIVSNIFKYTVPFLRTPTNIFKQGLEYSPTGFFTLIGAGNKQTQLTKAIIGSTVFAGGALLLSSGRLTWSEPVTDKDRNAFRAAGMLPYSVKIGDTWVQYQKLPPPLAFPLSMIALIDQAEKDKKLDQSVSEMIISSIAKYGDFLADQSYAKSIGDLLAALQGGESDWARVIGNVPQQFVPYRALGGWLTRLIDNVQRKPDPQGTFIEKQVQLLMLNIPGLSTQVPARTTGSGEEITSPHNIANAFSPARLSTPTEAQTSTYTDYLQLQSLNKEVLKKNSILNDQAKQTAIELLAMNKDAAKIRLKTILKENPELGKKIMTNLEDMKLNLTDEEAQLKSATVAARAQYIEKKLARLQTAAEKKKLLQEYKDKKILTSAVLDALLKLKQGQ